MLYYSCPGSLTLSQTRTLNTVHRCSEGASPSRHRCILLYTHTIKYILPLNTNALVGLGGAANLLVSMVGPFLAISVKVLVKWAHYGCHAVTCGLCYLCSSSVSCIICCLYCQFFSLFSFFLFFLFETQGSLNAGTLLWQHCVVYL